MSKYINTIEAAEQILNAIGVRRQDDGTFLTSIRGRYNFHHLTEEAAEAIIDEVLETRDVDWFDENHAEGTIELSYSSGNTTIYTVVYIKFNTDSLTDQHLVETIAAIRGLTEDRAAKIL